MLNEQEYRRAKTIVSWAHRNPDELIGIRRKSIVPFLLKRLSDMKEATPITVKMWKLLCMIEERMPAAVSKTDPKVRSELKTEKEAQSEPKSRGGNDVITMGTSNYTGRRRDRTHDAKPAGVVVLYMSEVAKNKYFGPGRHWYDLKFDGDYVYLSRYDYQHGRRMLSGGKGRWLIPFSAGYFGLPLDIPRIGAVPIDPIKLSDDELKFKLPSAIYSLMQKQKTLLKSPTKQQPVSKSNGSATGSFDYHVKQIKQKRAELEALERAARKDGIEVISEHRIEIKKVVSVSI